MVGEAVTAYQKEGGQPCEQQSWQSQREFCWEALGRYSKAPLQRKPGPIIPGVRATPDGTVLGYQFVALRPFSSVSHPFTVEGVFANRTGRPRNHAGDNIVRLEAPSSTSSVTLFDRSLDQNIDQQLTQEWTRMSHT